MDENNFKGFIYSIKNNVNNKIYIGQSKNPKERWKQHKNPKSSRFIIGKAIQKYGVNNFTFKIIDKAENQKMLDMLERLYISKYESMTYQWGYNLKEGGSDGSHSKETKKILLKRKNHWVGKKHTEETKKLMSSRQSKENHPMWNKKHKEESKIKMRESHMKKGFFGFSGVTLRKNKKPETCVWFSRIKWGEERTFLFSYPDPLSAEIVYLFVKEELYKGMS